MSFTGNMKMSVKPFPIRLRVVFLSPTYAISALDALMMSQKKYFADLFKRNNVRRL